MAVRFQTLGLAVVLVSVLGGAVYEGRRWLAQAAGFSASGARRITAPGDMPQTEPRPLPLERVKARPKVTHEPPLPSSAAVKAPMPATAAARPDGPSDVATLPTPVREMRELLLVAVASGAIEDLRTAIEVNELRPVVAATQPADPIAYWKTLSVDGAGTQVLAALAQVLEAGFADVPLGRDIENNKVYVWPYFADAPLKELSPGAQVELMRVVGPADFLAMRASGRYTGWRLAIGADGTWHSFQKVE